MHPTQEAFEKVWIQDVLVLSRNVMFCSVSAVSRNTRPPSPCSAVAGWCQAECCQVAIAHYTGGHGTP